jgi:hypothetical protein
MNAIGEHDDEPVRGLPEPLPPGERILWQGSPRWQALARDAFHVRKLAAYFGVILVLRGIVSWSDGRSVFDAVVAALWLLPLALLALGLLAVLAWLSARTTVYTITNRRVAMRIGIVLTMCLNLPFRAIAGAGLRTDRDGTGDIPLALSGHDHLAYLHLWPHVRPWRFAHPEPMLRGIPDAARTGRTLAAALAAAVGGTAWATAGASALPPASPGAMDREPQLAGSAD